MNQTPFDSYVAMRQTFITGLERLLEQPGLGNYILVYANASFDEAIHQQLRSRLRHYFDQHQANCRKSLIEGYELTGAMDDQWVFLKLMAIGFDGVASVRFRQAAHWELQYNPLRALRPSRITQTGRSGISQPFDLQGFHFNKPYLRKEAFWSGELNKMVVELLYNKFPFVPIHLLLVPERFKKQPQLLTRRYHDYAWNLLERLGRCLPHIHIAFNSYGAFASVNHLHFQLFVRSDPLPIMQRHWRHHGGDRDYPLDCKVYTASDQAWRYLEALHAQDISYNLIYQPGLLYCIPRRRQGHYEHAPWTRGFAWYELAGGVTTFNRSDYDTLDEYAIVAELKKLRVSAP
jgi:diadenosine tetraphosphate (Ap4A) HIT family hydrolase